MTDFRDWKLSFMLIWVWIVVLFLIPLIYLNISYWFLPHPGATYLPILLITLSAPVCAIPSAFILWMILFGFYKRYKGSAAVR